VEGWLFSQQTQQKRLLFATDAQFTILWANDSQHIVFYAPCYGGFVGSGLFSLNIKHNQGAVLSDDFVGPCEGQAPVLLQPGYEGRYLFAGNLYSLAGHETVQNLCGVEKQIRSAVFSETGKALYLACFPAQDRSQPDEIMRYDLTNHQRTTLLTFQDTAIQVVQMAVSPDERFLAFMWGSGRLGDVGNGVWVVAFDAIAPTRPRPSPVP
jgi:hypothetical protein